MNIYLAARYSRCNEMCIYAADLKRLGHEVTSRWINGSHQLIDRGLSGQAANEKRVQFASEDLDDILAAHTVVSFTEEPRSTNSRGGRHVELGIAIGMGKRNVIIGPIENVFHCLPEIKQYANWQEFLEWLEQGKEVR